MTCRNDVSHLAPGSLAKLSAIKASAFSSFVGTATLKAMLDSAPAPDKPRSARAGHGVGTGGRKAERAARSRDGGGRLGLTSGADINISKHDVRERGSRAAVLGGDGHRLRGRWLRRQGDAPCAIRARLR